MGDEEDCDDDKDDDLRSRLIPPWDPFIAVSGESTVFATVPCLRVLHEDFRSRLLQERLQLINASEELYVATKML